MTMRGGGRTTNRQATHVCLVISTQAASSNPQPYCNAITTLPGLSSEFSKILSSPPARAGGTVTSFAAFAWRAWSTWSA